jgi:hypothetical protein
MLEMGAMVVGLLLGFAVGRWWILAVAFLWLLVLVDYELDEVSPAYFVTAAVVLTSAGLAVGVLLRRGLGRLRRRFGAP